MNMVDDVRGEGVIKMMMVDDMGEGGIENDRKSDDVICGRPLFKTQLWTLQATSIKRKIESF